MSRVTIKDVAKKAGVSISTVSNALNDVDVLKPETKERILKIAHEMNYVPNFHGQSLKRGKTNRITFLTSSVIGPYFYRLVESMSLACSQHSYTLNIVVTSDRKEVSRILSGSEQDGIIIFQDLEIKDRQLNILRLNKTKALFIDRKIHDRNISSIVFDSKNISYKMTKNLVEKGCRKFLYIDGVETAFDSQERKAGFLKALSETAGATYDIVDGYFEEEVAKKAVKDYLGNNNKPDAIIGSNDLSAIGAIKSCVEAGYKLPEDIKIIGFDDIDIAQYVSPSLTTVSNPISELGKYSVEKLLKMINDDEYGDTTEINGIIIERESA